VEITARIVGKNDSASTPVQMHLAAHLPRNRSRLRIGHFIASSGIPVRATCVAPYGSGVQVPKSLQSATLHDE
jgi:hypothetical protein